MNKVHFTRTFVAKSYWKAQIPPIHQDQDGKCLTSPTVPWVQHCTYHIRQSSFYRPPVNHSPTSTHVACSMDSTTGLLSSTCFQGVFTMSKFVQMQSDNIPYPNSQNQHLFWRLGVPHLFNLKPNNFTAKKKKWKGGKCTQRLATISHLRVL